MVGTREPLSIVGLSDTYVRDVLDALAAPQDPVAGGPASAICAALAAALVVKVARASRADWVEAGGVVSEALVLREQVMALGATDAAAYREARSVLVRTAPTGSAHGGPIGPGAVPIGAQDRAAAITAALGDACEVALRIAELGAQIAALAAQAATEAHGPLRADAVVALELAAAATRGAAHLVEINRILETGDDRRARARTAVATCDAADASIRSPEDVAQR